MAELNFPEWSQVQAARTECLRISEKLHALIDQAPPSRSAVPSSSPHLRAIIDLIQQEEHAFQQYQRLLRGFLRVPQNTGRTGAVREDLTPRERAVLVLIAKGKTTKEIAYALSITIKTAEFHRTQSMRKLDAHNTADLTRAAIRLGLVEP